jgi:hypothetical protein
VAFDGDLTESAYDANSRLLAFCTLKDGYQRLLVYSPEQNTILDEREATADAALNMAFEDSVICLVGSKAVDRYRLRADGHIVRLETVVLSCYLSQFFVHEFYLEKLKRIVVFNKCLDSTIGTITLMMADSLVRVMEGIIPDHRTPGWSWTCRYRHATEELFVCDMGRMLYVADFRRNRLSKYSLGEQHSVDFVGDVLPLEGGGYIFLSCRSGQPCSQFRITDSLGLLNGAQ